MLKRILIALAAFIILLIGAALVLPGLVPTDTYREKLEGDLSRAFARDVTISGDIDISTFPVLKVETGSVSLANPEGFPQGQFVDVEAMSAKVRLIPLLRKRVEISGVTLKSPSIRLERQADGRANWIGKEDETAVEKGPFKRDGRFTEYDPALALLRIEAGTLQYVDATTGENFNLDGINLDLRAPGLDQRLRLNGEILFDGLETKIDAGIDSPADFLNGLETGFSADISTPEGEIDVSGQLLQSEDIAFSAKFNANSQKPTALAKRLPLPDDLEIPALNSVSANGEISHNPSATKLPSLEILAKGEGIETSFAGEVDLAEGASSSGAFSAKLDDLAIIQPYLDEPIEALDVLSAVNSQGNVQWSGNKFTLTDLQSAVTGPDLTASFNGKAVFNETLSITGSFDGETADLPALAQNAGLSQPDAAALKRVSAKGLLNFVDGKATVSNLTAETSEGLLTGQYKGDLTYGETLGLNGKFSGEISDLGALDDVLPRDIPYSDIAKRITISSEIQSQSTGYQLAGLTAKLQEGLLNGDFTGNLTLGDASDISGALTVSAQSLRAIATSQKIALPNSTDVGSIFENFSLSGQVTGTPERLIFNSGSIKLDDLSGTGDFVMDMKEPKPELTGTLSLSPLDLRPYMAAWSAQNPTGAILPWSTDQITLSGLESLDADVDITTPSIVMDRLELGATEGVVTLKNGTLTADLEKTQLYGGDAEGQFSIKSTNGIPFVEIDATIQSVAAQKFFMASAGFEKVTGTSDFSMSFVGQGKSQAEIMKSLSGDGVFKVIKGQLLGLDAGTLLSGVDQAITTRQLPDGIGLGKTTDFNDIISKFSLTNGRATITGFQLQSGDLLMDAEGAIDIGQQTIDIGIRPKLAGGSDLAGFGIPLRFTGGFGQTKAKLDTDLLGDIATARARKAAGDKVKDRLGGPLGNILGGVIGGETPSEETSPESPPQDELSPINTSPEDTATNPEAAEADETNSETPEEQIGNALKGLFGSKKKKEKTE
ncbi:MAG: AsmA family protein [Litorimonas sp.]